MTQQWLAWADAQHSNLKIELGQLLAAHELVRSAMGPEWVAQQERIGDTARMAVSAFHPLYRDLSSATNQAAVAVAELATYLTEFKVDPALPAVLDDLRSDKFPSSFFELAMAYRWKKAGAQITLQPTVPAGVADFEALLSELSFVVECSVSVDELFDQPSFRLTSLIADCITTMVEEPVALAAKLTVREHPSGDFHGELRRSAKKLCREALSQLHSGADTHVAEDAGKWLLEIEVVTETTEAVPGGPGWTLAVRVLEKPRTPGEPLYKIVDEKRQREKVRVFLKLPPDSDDPNERIIRKLKREARQLRGVAQPRLVMLDVSGIAEDILKFVGDEIQHRVLQVMRTIPELAGVWLTSRGWSTALRFQYRAAYLANPESTYQLPQGFLEKLTQLEWKWDFITDREIPWLPQDEALREWQRRSHPDPPARA
jgi:hypothetical protein